MPSRTEANGETKLVHYLDLNEFGLDELSEDQKQSAKREVAAYLKNEVLRTISNGESPVSGEGRFPALDSDYARKEKGGRRLSDLELEGDLKDSLISEPSSGSFIKYGHEGSQVPKADGHNQLTAKARNWARNRANPSTGAKVFPKRRYIPDDNQKFDGRITRGIKSIIDDFKASRPETRNERVEDEDVFNFDSQIRPAITSTNDTDFNARSGLFSDDVITQLLLDTEELRNR